MRKGYYAVGLCISVLLAAAIGPVISRLEYDAHWIHRTFEGTVTDVWGEEPDQYFSLRTENTYYTFVISEDTPGQATLEPGDQVLVESDYNMDQHNGKTVPYPVSLIAEPDIHSGD